MIAFIKAYSVPLFVGAICLALIFLPDALETSLSFQRTKIINGEWWRLLSANFLHLNTTHLLLNIAGLILVWLIFYNAVSSQWQIIFLLSGMISNTLFVLLFSPSVQNFVGLSGALHGVFVAFCIADLARFKWISIIGLAGVATKIVMEQLGWSGDTVEQWISNTVIIDAHLWGAVGGLLVGMLFTILKIRKTTANKRSL